MHIPFCWFCHEAAQIPVIFLSSDEKITENSAIEADKPTDDIRQEPYSLPTGFKWDTLDIRDPLIVGIFCKNNLSRHEVSNPLRIM